MGTLEARTHLVLGRRQRDGQGLEGHGRVLARFRVLPEDFLLKEFRLCMMSVISEDQTGSDFGTADVLSFGHILFRKGRERSGSEKGREMRLSPGILQTANRERTHSPL